MHDSLNDLDKKKLLGMIFQPLKTKKKDFFERNSNTKRKRKCPRQIFFTYYRSVGKTPVGETLPVGRDYDFVIKKCDDNESIAIPPGALITRRIGNPKKYSQEKMLQRR